MCFYAFGLVIALLGSAACAEPVESQKIITALSGDFNGDGGSDLAMILETEPGDPMDVHLFLRDVEHNYLKPLEVVRGKLYGEWNGFDRSGYENSDTEPTLALLANGSIRLEIPALPIGSRRTNQTLTLAWRDNELFVAGFAYEFFDAMDDTSGSSCEYNVLTGKGKSSKRLSVDKVAEKPVAVTGQTIPFRVWDFSMGIAACGG